MCGRYTLTKLEQILRQFPSITELPAEVAARFNIAPTQPIAAITNSEPDRLGHLYWGLVPSWAKDVSIGSKMINARGETIAEKPAFRAALRRRRCLIPADGFYEWQRNPDGKTKTPMYIRVNGGEVFAFAGLWETWHSPDGSELMSATIITTSPNTLMSDIHDRMPVIVPPGDYDRWLAKEEQEPADLMDLIRPYPADRMEFHPVSRMVNSPRNDLPACIAPVASDSLF